MKILHFAKPALFGLAASAAVLFALGSASAQSFERLVEADANGNGQIEWQEMLDLREETFGRLDRNDDGFADSADTPRFGPVKNRFGEALARLQSVDANGDGRISKQEMFDAPAPLFEQGDTNGNKVLSGDEIAALRETGLEN